MEKKGLTQQEAIKKNQEYGLNEIEKQKKQSIIKIVLSQFKDVTVYLLLFATILSILLGEYVDSIIIFIVLVINSTIGTIQEIKAENSIAALKKLSSPNAKVYRDGNLIEIDTKYLTIGDVVYLEEGDIVPADIHITDCNNLKIDESLLTGESFPVEKKDKCNKVKSNNIIDRLCDAFASSKVISGNCEGIVYGIGMQTEVGKIAKQLNTNEKMITPLQQRLEKLSKWLGIIIVGIVLVVFLIAMIFKMDRIEMLIFSISLAVAAIPEGLPAVVTIVLSLGVRKLAMKKTIVRKLPSVETLGSVEIVCTDKTGTITKNELEVQKIYSGIEETSKVEGLLKDAFLFCNSLKENKGDPIDVALVNYCKNNGFLADKGTIKIKERPFESELKIMSCIIKKDGKKVYLYKGAPEIIISKCSTMFNGSNISLYKYRINETLLDLQTRGYRTLAFAYSYDDKVFSFLGVVGFSDPIRENIAELISVLKKAGIKTIMITGDHKITAYEISKQAGITNSIDECITGDELDQLIEKGEPIDKYKVFARANPSHKAMIIDYYQRKNYVVAMTGDGVNDCPALKKADIGIAMGEKGSDVAKESADMVLTDDNFSTIENAIEEGRNVYINIKKAVLFLLSSNLGEILSVVLFVLLKLPTPLLSIHILWVNLISDSLPALALGSDKKYTDIMDDEPRKKDESIFANKGLFITLFYGILIFILTSVSFLIYPIIALKSQDLSFSLSTIRYILQDEAVLTKARTFAFTTLGMTQLFHMLGMSNVRANLKDLFKHFNGLKAASLIVGIGLQLILLEIPLFSNFFKITHLNALELLWLLGIAVIPLLFQQLLRKTYKRGL